MFIGLTESVVMFFILLRSWQALSFKVFLLPCPPYPPLHLNACEAFPVSYPLHASSWVFLLISLCSLIFNETSLLIICPLSLLYFFTSGKSGSVIVFYQSFISYFSISEHNSHSYFIFHLIILFIPVIFFP